MNRYTFSLHYGQKHGQCFLFSFGVCWEIVVICKFYMWQDIDNIVSHCSTRDIQWLQRQYYVWALPNSRLVLFHYAACKFCFKTSRWAETLNLRPPIQPDKTKPESSALHSACRYPGSSKQQNSYMDCVSQHLLWITTRWGILVADAVNAITYIDTYILKITLTPFAASLNMTGVDCQEPPLIIYMNSCTSNCALERLITGENTKQTDTGVSNHVIQLGQQISKRDKKSF